MPGPNGAPYVTPDQLTNWIPAATLGLATAAQQLQACIDATSRADSYLRGRYEMPLLDWEADLTVYTAYIAIFILMNGPIGMAPQAGADSNVGRNYCSAVGGPDPLTGAKIVGWFEKVQRQAIQVNLTPSIAVGSDPGHDAPQVSSQPRRGWQQVRGGKPVVGGF